MDNKVSVIIPTMNRCETLKETLDSYILSCHIPEQIIIVDQTQDANKRSSIQQMVEQYSRYTEISYFFQNTPSLTQARNNGFLLAKYEIIIFSDDDITVDEKTVGNAIRLMQNKTISLIAGINNRDRFNRSIIGYIFCKKSFRYHKIGHVTKSVFGRFPDREVIGIVDTQWAMGFFFVIRKSLMTDWKICWDEKMTGYAYAEDLDFSYTYYLKSCENGLKCILSDLVKVEHRVSSEWRTPSQKSTMMYVINRVYLSYKHKMGLLSRIAIKWSDFGEFIRRCIKKESPMDLIHAEVICEQHRKEIKRGDLNPKWYEE